MHFPPFYKASLIRIFALRKNSCFFLKFSDSCRYNDLLLMPELANYGFGKVVLSG